MTINKKFIWIGSILILISILLFCYVYFFVPRSSENINPSAPQGVSIVYDFVGMKEYVYLFSFGLGIIGFVFVISGLVKINVSAREK